MTPLWDSLTSLTEVNDITNDTMRKTITSLNDMNNTSKSEITKSNQALFDCIHERY